MARTSISISTGGRGFLVGQAQFDVGTQRGNAIMIGSSAQLIEKPRP